VNYLEWMNQVGSNTAQAQGMKYILRVNVVNANSNNVLQTMVTGGSGWRNRVELNLQNTDAEFMVR
jgi:hypothetical protein